MVPQKIKSHFQAVCEKKERSNTIIEGIFTCCNSQSFEIYVNGKVKHGIFSRMYISQDDQDDNEIVFEVRCKKCGKIINVFNSNYDGYDNCQKELISHSKTKIICCNICSSNNYSVAIKYEYPDTDELKNIGITEIDNAFTWIWVTLKCNECGKKYCNFIDFEAG